MKGKKVDQEFLSKFISNCVIDGISSSEEIAEFAKKEISKIDKQIRDVEKLKVVRSKLLDVVATFEKSPKSQNKEAKLLPLYKIQNQNIAHFICSKIMMSKIDINDLYKSDFTKSDLVYCIKQLLEAQVLIKDGCFLSPGELFDSYCSIIRL
jgi:hypothetical protein